MSKFKFRVKLTGLEIEVEGERQHAQEMAESVGAQLSDMLRPNKLLEPPPQQPRTIDAAPPATKHSRGRKRSSAKLNGAANPGEAPAPEWEHDPSKWGTPVQDWKATEKIAWLLLVMEKATGVKQELTPSQIEKAFNNKFRSAGKVNRGNVGRDLKKITDQFGEMDGKWFLKDKGRQEAERLLGQATGKAV